MKRIIIAMVLAVFAAPVFADQPDSERYSSTAAESASAGTTATEPSVWAQDHNYISPAQ